MSLIFFTISDIEACLTCLNITNGNECHWYSLPLVILRHVRQASKYPTAPTANALVACAIAVMPFANALVPCAFAVGPFVSSNTSRHFPPRRAPYQIAVPLQEWTLMPGIKASVWLRYVTIHIEIPCSLW